MKTLREVFAWARRELGLPVAIAKPDAQPPREQPADMTFAEHQARHVELHRMLDELVADYIRHQPYGGKLLHDTSVMELMDWSHKQTLFPTKPRL